MMTRTTAAGHRVEVWQPTVKSPAWAWRISPADPAKVVGTTRLGFPTLADAIADAQRALGADVAITRHCDLEPKP